jgi:hypothetical protein
LKQRLRHDFKTQTTPGPPMTLVNMRHLGVHHLVATCLNDACRHQGLIDVSKYPDDTPVPSFFQQDRVRQVRGAWPSHRRAAELERSTEAHKRD